MPGNRVSIHLLVDGYNIIGDWPHLLTASREDGLEAARHHLIEAMSNYSAARGFHTQLVFDAYGSQLPLQQEVVTDRLSVYYTESGQTADTYIEKACAQLRHSCRTLRQRVIVATSDRAQQLTVVGYGAEWMSARKLEVDVRSAQQQTRQATTRHTSARGSTLARGLDPKTREKLSRLRFGP